jgi:DNA invertase Pin-like site-specific DNA recombinase
VIVTQALSDRGHRDIRVKPALDPIVVRRDQRPRRRPRPRITQLREPQGIDTTTPAGRFLFHVIAAMDEMLADLISEATLEGLESARARGRVGSADASRN